MALHLTVVVLSCLASLLPASEPRAVFGQLERPHHHQPGGSSVVNIFPQGYAYQTVLDDGSVSHVFYVSGPQSPHLLQHFLRVPFGVPSPVVAPATVPPPHFLGLPAPPSQEVPTHPTPPTTPSTTSHVPTLPAPAFFNINPLANFYNPFHGFFTYFGQLNQPFGQPNQSFGQQNQPNTLPDDALPSEEASAATFPSEAAKESSPSAGGDQKEIISSANDAQASNVSPIRAPLSNRIATTSAPSSSSVAPSSSSTPSTAEPELSSSSSSRPSMATSIAPSPSEESLATLSQEHTTAPAAETQQDTTQEATTQTN